MNLTLICGPFLNKIPRICKKIKSNNLKQKLKMEGGFPL